ncbi:glycosyltransferase [Thiomicrorhabdus sp. 6S2-11]|uniref:Glycosyltransferase n=1 Tax=Thiomicrorhabdus marina TaxID=2818442 RepID=A0ABS3Q2Z5_9GAMM|nr:glycosyltransferase [Thiomicrorhabdus marina]MBO1926319.1 glycosyltransferase [Thiomicrorhabdus marina]
MPYFSIIIPVYNVADYLSQCVDSVLNQTYRDFEIILVNDCSTDNSLPICEEYSAKEQNIRLIDLSKNLGSSVARNTGVDNSKGQYLIFLDSDDFWDSSDALQNIATKLKSNSADLLLFHSKDYLCSTGKVIEPQSLYSSVLSSPTDNLNFIRSSIDSGLFPGAAWVTVVKSSLLKKCSIHFSQGRRAEDIDWLFEVISVSEKIDYVDDVFHVYRKFRNGSITMTPNLKHLQDLLWVIEKWKTKTISEKLFKNADTHILKYLAYHLAISILMYSQLSSTEKMSVKPDILKLLDLLSFGSLKYTASYNLIRVIGLNNFSRLLQLIYLLKKKLIS